MDIKELLKWSWNHRLWFGISLLLCIGVGALYYFSATPKHIVSAAIMLRSADTKTQQGQMMSIMGETGAKQAADEIKILSSLDLMAQVVDSIEPNIIVEKRKGLRFIPVYPKPAFASEYQPDIKREIYKRVEDGQRYRITVYPKRVMVSMLVNRLSVQRLSRESQVIKLSIKTANPRLAEDMLNLLLDLYNRVSFQDKNAIALQTQSFLDERIAAVQAELNEAESMMEMYKSTHQITNIDATASEYQRLIEDYQLQLAAIDLEQRVLDDLDKQLQTPMTNNGPRMLYADFQTGTMSAMIEEYNKNVAKRIDLLAAATENNPTVLALNQTLTSQRENIIVGASEVRQSVQTRRQHLTEQINLYSSKLSRLPEQERTYMEMKRNKETKEQQYLYLIEKREENALFLASSSISVMVVEKAQITVPYVTPKWKKTAAVSVLVGLLLPLIVFFFGLVKKEFM